VTSARLEQLRHQLVSALEYIEGQHIVHPDLTPDNIIFTENIGNLKLIDVGYEQRPRLSHQSTADDIYNYGKVLTEALDAVDSKDPVLRRVARKCTDPDPKRRFRDMQQVHLALEGRGNSMFYFIIIAFLALMLFLVIWLKSPYAPSPTTLNAILPNSLCLLSSFIP